MSEHAPDPSVDHFGPDGTRRIDVPVSYAPGLTDETRRILRDIGVPARVAPYFTAADASDGPTLTMFAGHRGVVWRGEQADWVRIGTDRLASLCVRPDGEVRAVFLARPEPDVFVNRDVRAFTTSLAALDRRLPVIAAATSLPGGAAAFRELTAELRRIDPDAFEGPDHWWPRVLDDVRHTLNFPFSAAFEYVGDDGRKQIVTAATGPGKAHPEELVWQRLAAAGVASHQVRRVYCELQACMLPGHYCAVWMEAAFPQAEFTHSFDYGVGAESREEGIKRLIAHAAQQNGPHP